MPKKIIDDSDSSSESEPEQYDNKIVNDSNPKVKIIKLEKPKRVMSEKQLENLKRGRENRVKARQEKQLQETTAPTVATPTQHLSYHSTCCTSYPSTCRGNY
jgi:uncharacterized protein (DUF39 family)